MGKKPFSASPNQYILHISHFETERAFVILSSCAKRHRAECDTSSTQEFLMFLDDNSATGRIKNWCYRCKFNSIRRSQIRLMRRRSFSHTCSTSQLMMAKLYKNHHKVGFLRRGARDHIQFELLWNQSSPWAANAGALCAAPRAFACDSCGTRWLWHFPQPSFQLFYCVSKYYVFNILKKYSLVEWNLDFVTKIYKWKVTIIINILEYLLNALGVPIKLH